MSEEKECCGTCEVEKTSPVKIHLALVKLESGHLLIGRVNSVAHDLWVRGATKLILEGGRELLIQQVQDKDTQQVVGFQTGVVPVYPLKTPQEHLTINASKIVHIEMLGELEETAGGTFTCAKSSQFVKGELLKFYNDSITSWRAELSGIVPPTANDMSAIKGDIRRFKK